MRTAYFGAVVALGLAFAGPDAAWAQAGVPAEPTFARDIAPILQRSCENCHRVGGVAPMALSTYEQVRPWARAIKTRTGLGPRAGVMPPWYVEKDIGIQHYKDDPSLSDIEVATIAKWADSGAPAGNLAEMPPPRQYQDDSVWTIGEPDLVVKLPELVVKADAPDWWGEIASTPTGLTEDRYVAALEIKEVNDVPTDGSGRATVGGRYVFHHMIWGTDRGGAEGTSTPWPVHEVGRNADFFPPEGGRLLRAGSSIVSNSVHLHSNGRDTTAHLLIGFKLHPVGYKPTVRASQSRALGNGVDISIRPMDDNQTLHAYTVLQEHTKIVSFEPHLHAPGKRMCLEAIFSYTIQTLTCAGYDHNWVRGYTYDDDHAPLLPKGTILHIIGFMDNSPTNRNVPDPRNWQGSGNRSVANMFIDLGEGVSLTDEQFMEEMAKRKQKLNLTMGQPVLGCPLCSMVPDDFTPAVPAGQQQGN